MGTPRGGRTCSRASVEEFNLISITKYDFSRLFGEAWIKAMTPKNILSGFAVTGICPLNRNALVAGGIRKSPDKPKLPFSLSLLLRNVFPYHTHQKGPGSVTVRLKGLNLFTGVVRT